MGLPSLSQNVWVYIIALMGVRHLISPRWLEEMFLYLSKAALACMLFPEKAWGSRTHLLLTGLIHNCGECFAGADGLEFPVASLSLCCSAAAHLHISRGM